MPAPLIDQIAVDHVFHDCLYQPEEVSVDKKSPEDAVIVQGVMHTFGFHPQRLESHRAEVKGWLDDLPVKFRASSGGGWSFLNLCEDRNGTQWTGLHLACEQLITMAIGLGLGEYPLPRELWDVAPGGMPYFTYLDKEPV